MAIKNRTWAAIILLILLLNMVNAQEKDPYKDENFLIASDATTWDTSKIPLGNPIVYSNPSIYNRNDIYSVASVYTYRDFFQNLPDDKYKLLDYKKVNYDLISNHNKIDSSKYLKDLGCSACSFDRGNQNIKFSENGISHSSGDFVSIPGSYPTGTLFVAKADRIEIIMPKGVTQIDIPNSDKVTINTQDRLITISDGTKLSGKLSYRNGQPYIRGDDFVIIDGVEIKALRQDIYLPRENEAVQDNEILLFLDGNPHTGVAKDYVSLNGKSGNLFVYTNNGKGISLDFKEGNNFLYFEKDDFAHIEIKKSELSIENRNTNDLIPLVNVKERPVDSEFKIQSGIVNINGKGKFITTDSNNPINKKSSPMAVIISDSMGNLLGGQKDPNKIIISNFNEIAIIPVNKQEGLIINSEQYDYSLWKISENLYFNYDTFTPENLKKTFPNIALSGRLNDDYIKKLSETLFQLTPELRNSINNIIIYTEDEFKETYPTSRARALSDFSRNVKFRIGTFSQSAVIHEIAHTRLQQILEEQYRINFKTFNLFSSVDKPIDKEWENIAGDYNKDLIRSVNTESSVDFLWSDGTTGPKYGCVTPYGCTWYREDLAEFVRISYLNPSSLKSLVDTSRKDYDPRYKQKLDLLYKHGFIPEEKYNIILGK